MFSLQTSARSCVVYTLSTALQSQTEVGSLTFHIYNPTFPSPGVRHSYCCTLPFCLPADLSHIRPWPAVQYCMEGASSAGLGGSSILYSDGREHSAPPGFKDSPAQTRMFPFVKSSLKRKEPFLQLTPIVPKSLQCWDVGTS